MHLQNFVWGWYIPGWWPVPAYPMGACEFSRLVLLALCLASMISTFFGGEHRHKIGSGRCSIGRRRGGEQFIIDGIEFFSSINYFLPAAGVCCCITRKRFLHGVGFHHRHWKAGWLRITAHGIWVQWLRLWVYGPSRHRQWLYADCLYNIAFVNDVICAILKNYCGYHGSSSSLKMRSPLSGTPPSFQQFKIHECTDKRASAPPVLAGKVLHWQWWHCSLFAQWAPPRCSV